jgi:hypothetical protein
MTNTELLNISKELSKGHTILEFNSVGDPIKISLHDEDGKLIKVIWEKVTINNDNSLTTERLE